MSAVLRLYEFSYPPYQKRITGFSKYELVDCAGRLHDAINQKIESEIFGCNFDLTQIPENILQGKGYTCRILHRKQPQKASLKKKCPVRLRGQIPEQFISLLDKSDFRCVRNTKIHPMFLVDVKESEANISGFDLQLSIQKKNDFTLKYIILEQDFSTKKWMDITSLCTTGRGTCPEITIPVRKKSARIWAIHLKRSLCSQVPSLLSILNDEDIASNGEKTYHFSFQPQELRGSELQSVDDSQRRLSENVDCRLELKWLKSSQPNDDNYQSFDCSSSF